MGEIKPTKISLKIQYCKANLEDLNEISQFRSLFESVPINDKDPTFYLWKCFENVVGEGEFWIARYNGIIVGTKSVTPKMILIDDVTSIAGEMGDSFVHPNYRNIGIFSTLTKLTREAAIAEGIEFIYNLPNLASYPIYINNLEHMHIETLHIRGLSYPISSSDLIKRRYPKIPFIRVISAITSKYLKILLRVQKFISQTSDLSISRVFAFTDHFTDLYKLASQNYSVSIVRDRKYLDYRFIKPPENYTIFQAQDKLGSLIGYIVLKTAIISSMKYGYIVDFLTVDKKSYVFRKLLLTGLTHLMDEKVAIIVTWSVENSIYAKTFLKFGFFYRSKVPVLFYGNELNKKLSRKNLTWHFTMADSDNI